MPLCVKITRPTNYILEGLSRKVSDVWSKCLQALRTELEQYEYERWISPLSVKLDQYAKQLSVIAPDDQFADRLNAHPIWLRIEELLSIYASHLRVELSVKQLEDSMPALHSMERMVATSKTEENIRLANLQPQFSFSNFVMGEANAIVTSVAKQIAENPHGVLYNPLFIYGRSGLGKSHLLYAIGNHLARYSDAKVHYQHAPRFVSNFVKALKDKKMEDFKRFYNSFDVLLFDDVHLFSDKAGTQEELFQIINRMLERHKPVVFTCDRYPKDLEGFSDRLRSRFGAGVSLEMKPPELEMRVAILEAKAKDLGMELSEDVAFLIARKIRSNVRELCSALATLKVHHEFSNNQPLTLLTATKALEQAFGSHTRAVTIEKVLRSVADFYHLRQAELTGRSRRQPIVRARHMAMALCKELTSESIAEIGRHFSRDHTTVLHACRNIEQMRQNMSGIDRDFNTIFITLSD